MYTHIYIHVQTHTYIMGISFQILSPMVNYHAVPWHVKETYHSIKYSIYFPAGVKDHAGSKYFFLLSRHLKMWFSGSLEPTKSLSFLSLCGDVTSHGHAGPLFSMEVWKSFSLCVDIPFGRLDSGYIPLSGISKVSVSNRTYDSSKLEYIQRDTPHSRGPWRAGWKTAQASMYGY